MTMLLRLLVARFQSTLPREERLGLAGHLRAGLNFNPRSHERSDKAQNYLKRYYIISIHAPTRGATVFRVYEKAGKLDFNPRSHERSDIKHLEFDGKEYISIHAPTRGATASR